MGLKRLESRHITLQLSQNSGLNELKWIYDLIYKNLVEWEGVAETQSKTRIMKFWFDYWNIYTYIDLSMWMTAWLIDTIYEEADSIHYATKISAEAMHNLWYTYTCM